MNVTRRTRRNGGQPRPKGYVCEWSCGKAFRDGADYTAHVERHHLADYLERR